MEFQDFLTAVTDLPASARQSTWSYDRVTILGGGHDARLLAALCAAQNKDVQLFSAYASELAALAGGIALNGDGPVGRYHVAQESSEQSGPAHRGAGPRGPAIRTTGSLDACLTDAELVFLTGPVHKQRTYAMVLADHLKDGQVLVLPNARTFGAFEAAWLLKVGGCTVDFSVVELQGLPFWLTASASGLSLEKNTGATAACLPADRTHHILGGLTSVFPDLRSLPSVLHSSFHDCSAIIDVPALAIGGVAISPGGPVIPQGGEPLPENNNFFNLLGEQQLQIVEELYNERVLVASRYGVRDLPNFETTVHYFAGQQQGPGKRSIPEQLESHLLLRDGAIGSLVPLVDAAKIAGIDVPLTQSIIHVCSSILGSDVSVSGRRMLNLGIESDEHEQVYTRLASTAKAGH